MDKPQYAPENNAHIPTARKLSIASYFSGPLPPPEELQKYETACKGAANRIIKMAENQSSHRQEIEKNVIKSNIYNEKTGMVLAFILTVFFISAGTALIIFDKPIAGYLALFGVGGFNAYNYITKKKEEKEAKDERKRLNDAQIRTKKSQG